MNPKLTPEQLQRVAVVYIRQSSPTQVVENLESQRRQYALADKAKEMGFAHVETIDDDLGRSGSGVVERPGFSKLVAMVCEGKVGAVFCIEASRLARNGRDWHHLIDLCSLVGTVIIDHDGIYNPRVINDRLLLGLKGTMSEFELTLLRQRSEEGLRQKAKRGELKFCLPIGFQWTRNDKIEIDPDKRIQEAIRLVFKKFQDLGSARQVLLWFRDEKISLPATKYDDSGSSVHWKLPIYKNILAVLSNPLYGGAYVFGKTEVRTKVVDGRARKTQGHRKPREKWMVFIKDHHPGYISWQRFERIQMTLLENTHMRREESPKSGRGGKALLIGLVRCRRCGRMMRVAYAGPTGEAPRYACLSGMINHGVAKCISFGALRVDRAMSSEIVRAVEKEAVEAALMAADQLAQQESDRKKALTLELEQARYEVALAARRYEAVDPSNRLVAAELESRWNHALNRVKEIEENLERAAKAEEKHQTIPDRDSLMALASNLYAVWDSPMTDMRLKQRIVRLLINEVAADLDENKSETVLTIHWKGGRHSELRVAKNRTGRHGRCTDMAAIDIIKQMASRWADETIAATLNRLELPTGAGNAWNRSRVRTVRSYHSLPAHDPSKQIDGSTLTLDQATKVLGINRATTRKLLEQKIIPATQVVSCAPWEIPKSALESKEVLKIVDSIRKGGRIPRSCKDETENLIFPGL